MALLLAAQPQLFTPVLQLVQHVLTRFLLGQAGLKTCEAQFRAPSARAKPDKADQAESGAVTLIQRLGSSANLMSVHLHCLVLDGVYRRGIDGEPVFVAVPAPTDGSPRLTRRRPQLTGLC